MSPACRAPVANNIWNTAGFVLLSEDLSPEQSEMNISPLLTPRRFIDGNELLLIFSFYVNLSGFSLAKGENCLYENVEYILLCLLYKSLSIKIKHNFHYVFYIYILVPT